jgi:WD40 repeat protein
VIRVATLINGGITVFSPDGKQLASGSLDKSIKLWDVATGKEQATLKGHAGWAVYTMSWSPDGKTLASASWDQTVKVWEAASWRLLHDLPHPSGVQCVAFDRDGPRLAWGSTDGTVTVWDGPSTETHTLRGHTKPITALAFNPSGRLLASAGEDQTVKIWDATTGQDARAVRAHLACQALTFSPDGQRLASAEDGVRVWEPGSGRLLRAFGGSAGPWAIPGSASAPSATTIAQASNGRRRCDPVAPTMFTLASPCRWSHTRPAIFDGR